MTIKKSSSSSKKTAPKKAGASASKSKGFPKDAVVKDKATGADVLTTNSARDARVLLDIISQSGNVSLALSGVLNKLDGVVPLSVVQSIKVAQEAAANVDALAQKQAAKVSTVPYVAKAYAKLKAEEKEENARFGIAEATPLGKLRVFNRSCSSGGVLASLTMNAGAKQIPSGNEKRSSPRTKKATASKDGVGDFTGLPPQGTKIWSKEDIVAALSPYEGRARKLRITAILSKRRTHYKSDGGIYRLLKSCKGGKSPRREGRPGSVEASDVKDISEERAAETSGRGVKLSVIQGALEDKRKAAVAKSGVAPDSVDCSISKDSAKIAAISAAMRGDFGLDVSNKKLQTKTTTRFIAENSFKSMYSYATTVLATHLVVGDAPRDSTYDYSRLSQDARDTVDWVAEAHGVDSGSVHPVDPNLVLSTDDTTVFGFYGSADGDKDWEWQFLTPSENSGHLSDYAVGVDAENSGGLRARLTFTETATGLLAPPYVAISGLTSEELPVEHCPDGILAQRVPGLCKGGSNDVFAEGSGWLTFLRADAERGEMSIANKKFVQYYQDVLLPFVRKIREKLGWRKGQPVPDYLTAVSWFDGDIPQLQTMLYEARVCLDEIEKICNNKHASAATAIQQPCDLAPIFRLLKELNRRATAAGDIACGLKQTIVEIFDSLKVNYGLNLAPRKKKALIDFLCCLPAILEKVATKDNIRLGFTKAGMIDETGYVPVFRNLMNTCRRQRSLELDALFRSQLLALLKIQLEHGQITYDEMAALGIPPDFGPDGKEVTRIRLSGPDGEHLQPAKQINHTWQKQLRDEKRRKEAQEQYYAALVKFNTIKEILRRNSEIENLLKSKTTTGVLVDSSVAEIMKLSIPQLKDFVHARRFDGPTFHSSQLAVSGKKLNKTLFKGQTAEQILSLCSEENPCFVWLAHSLLSSNLLLQLPAEPTMDAFIVAPNPTFVTVYAGSTPRRTPEEYLRSEAWVSAIKLCVKGVSFVDIDDELVVLATTLLPSLDSRFDRHVAGRVDETKRDHPVLKFVSANLPAVSALLALCGQISDDLESESIDSCLLRLPVDGVCQLIAGDLEELEGCYLYYDRTKARWIRSGKTSGASGASFKIRGKKHAKNAEKLDEMRILDFYRMYPVKGVPNLGGRKGYFDNLDMYCAMAFDRSEDLSKLCPNEHGDDVFVWSKEIIAFLNKRSEPLKHSQLDMLAYLWEIAFDVLLAKDDNVSKSPGFETFGLRFDGKKRKRNGN